MGGDKEKDGERERGMDGWMDGVREGGRERLGSRGEAGRVSEERVEDGEEKRG